MKGMSADAGDQIRKLRQRNRAQSFFVFVRGRSGSRPLPSPHSRLSSVLTALAEGLDAGSGAARGRKSELNELRAEVAQLRARIARKVSGRINGHAHAVEDAAAAPRHDSRSDWRGRCVARGHPSRDPPSAWSASAPSSARRPARGAFVKIVGQFRAL
jgi:hypothetical protein